MTVELSIMEHGKANGSREYSSIASYKEILVSSWTFDGTLEIYTKLFHHQPCSFDYWTEMYFSNQTHIQGSYLNYTLTVLYVSIILNTWIWIYDIWYGLICEVDTNSCKLKNCERLSLNLTLVSNYYKRIFLRRRIKS